MADEYCDKLIEGLESRLRTGYLPGFTTDIWDMGVEYLLRAGVVKKSARRKIPTGREYLSPIYDEFSTLRLPVRPAEWERYNFPDRLVSPQKLRKSPLYYQIPDPEVGLGYDGVPLPISLSQSLGSEDVSDDAANDEERRYSWLSKTRTGYPTAFAVPIASSDRWIFVLPAGTDTSEVLAQLQALGRSVDEKAVVEAKRVTSTIHVSMTAEEVKDQKPRGVTHFTISVRKGSGEQVYPSIPCLQFLRFIALWCASQRQYRGIAYTTKKEVAGAIGLLVIEGQQAISAEEWTTCVLSPKWKNMTQTITRSLSPILSAIGDDMSEIDDYLQKESFPVNRHSCQALKENISNQVQKLTVRRMHDVALYLDDAAIAFMKECTVEFSGAAQPDITSGTITAMLDEYERQRDGSVSS